MDGDVVLSMLVCSLFLRDVPMGFREKVILSVLIMKWMDMYIKTESDIVWAENQLKKMEADMNNVTRRADTIEWNRTSDDEIYETI